MNLANSAWVGAATIDTAGFLSVPLGGLLADSLAKRTPIGRFLTLVDWTWPGGLLLLPLLVAKTALRDRAGSRRDQHCEGPVRWLHLRRHARRRAAARRERRPYGMMTMIGFFGAGFDAPDRCEDWQLRSDGVRASWPWPRSISSPSSFCSRCARRRCRAVLANAREARG